MTLDTWQWAHFVFYSNNSSLFKCGFAWHFKIYHTTQPTCILWLSQRCLYLSHPYFPLFLVYFFSSDALDILKERCCSSNIASAIFICNTEEAISGFLKHANLWQTSTTVGLPALCVWGFYVFKFWLHWIIALSLNATKFCN